LEIAQEARRALEHKKGEDVVIVDVTGLSSVTDYFVICTGRNTPQIKALAQEVEQHLKRQGAACYRRAGTPESQWLVVDYLDTVVHIFSPETRTYYALEELWKDAPRI
jgi:ribosome-associated protein